MHSWESIKYDSEVCLFSYLFHFVSATFAAVNFFLFPMQTFESELSAMFKPNSVEIRHFFPKTTKGETLKQAQVNP